MQEQFFHCPHCWQKVSILVDVSVEGRQTFVEDCEVCCNPLTFEATVESGRISSFHSEAAQ